MKTSTNYRVLLVVLVFLLLAIAMVMVADRYGDTSPIESQDGVSSRSHKFMINGLSMESEFSHGEIVMVDTTVYISSTPQKGDVIAFQFPQAEEAMVKRVIAVPGDSIKFSEGSLFINNKIVIPAGRFHPVIWKEATEHIIAADKYFVLSDNHTQGEDSRIWGLVSLRDVIGKVLTK